MNNIEMPTSSSDPVFVEDISSQERVFSTNTTYRKGAWVLHSLRHVVGDDVFYDILAEYRSRFEGGAATTEDFQKACEDVFGRDLSWFFHQWVYYGPWPKYYWAWVPHEVDGRHYVEVYIRQQQTLGFKMPVDFHVRTNGQPAIHTVWNDARRENLLFPVDGPPDSVDFDPNQWFLRRDLLDTPFVEGPPKIVTMHPEPEDVITDGTLAEIEIVFHKDVVVDPNHFTLVGQHTGPVSLSLAYDAGRYAATLTPPAPLGPDRYQLVVSDQVIDVVAAKQLDGELRKVWFPDPLPSGDGRPGGSAVAWFVVTMPYSGDMNCDGVTDVGDVNAFTTALVHGEAAYDAKYPNCNYEWADVNGDGAVDYYDINPFVALLTQ
jgi:hypothetical protein